jgi:hypothetical protein
MISARAASETSANMLAMPSAAASPSHRNPSGAPSSAIPRRASRHAAAQPPAYGTAQTSVAETARSANEPVSASTAAAVA